MVVSVDLTLSAGVLKRVFPQLETATVHDATKDLVMFIRPAETGFWRAYSWVIGWIDARMSIAGLIGDCGCDLDDRPMSAKNSRQRHERL